jgi:predicted permease
VKARPVQLFSKPHLWLIALVGVIVPRRLRADWRQEWEAELRCRERLLAEWERLDWRNKLDLLRRSLGAFWDALLLQPKRLEDEMFQDLRYGVRMLLKNPGFTALAVLSLALGIGANAAIFSLLDAVLLKMLPVKQPEQLVFLEQSGAPEFKRSSNISYAAFERLRAQSQVLSGACFFSYTTRLNASLNGQGEIVEGQMVSGGFFSVLGVDAVAGRTFTEADDKETSAAAVAVISYKYWQQRFGMNPNAVGQTVVLNSAPVTIIGVAPPEFFGVIIGNAPDIFLPSATGERILPRRFRFRADSLPFVLARLKPGVAPQAGAALSLLLQQSLLEEAGSQLPPEKQQAIQRQTMKLLPADQGFSMLRQQFSAPLRLLMAVVGLVLLIACANVANLLLARAAARRKEIAVRLALGASRLRLIRQLLTESLLLALAGGVAGLLLAAWCSGLLLAVVSSGRNPVTNGSRLSLNAPLDGRVVGFTVLVSLLAVVLFGLAPAWRATRLELSPTLKDNARAWGGSGRFRWGQTLVVAQVALSLALLIGAGLFVRSLSKLKSTDIGFKRENVLLFSVDPQLIRYQKEQIAGLYKQMLERITTVPGVQSVSLARQGLLNGGGTQGSITVPGHASTADENSITQTREGSVYNAPWLCQVGPRFFETAGMTLLRGRDFGPQDHETARKVAVVNEAFARYYFGNADPLGQRFDRGKNDGGEVEIIGVVKDAKAVSIREQTPRTFYVPFLQDPGAWRETTFQVRTAGNPLHLVAEIRRAVQGVDPNLPLFRVRTLEAQVDESLGQERLVATLASLFGALALLLACAGLYGVLSYSVSQRTHEIGIRLALGAPPGRVLWMVLRETYALVLAGIVIGAAASFAAGRLIASMLFGLTPTDPVTALLAVILMIGVASLAGWLPARRAARVAPLVALRHE